MTLAWAFILYFMLDFKIKLLKRSILDLNEKLDNLKLQIRKERQIESKDLQS